MENSYDKMEEYITSVFNVFKMVNRKAEQQQDKRLKMISLVIYNYSRYMANEYKLDLKMLTEEKEDNHINLIPIFEYVSVNNIELYDFSNINVNDVDMTKKEDLERFVLSHIYYITQNKK